MSNLNLYHSTTHNQDELIYKPENSSDYIDYDTCPYFEKLIREQSLYKLGFDIQDALYTYTSIKDYSAYNFGSYFYSVEIEEGTYKAYMCPNIEDVVLDYKINTNFLMDILEKEIAFITYGQLNIQEDMDISVFNKYLNSEGRFFLEEENQIFDMIETARVLINEETNHFIEETGIEKIGDLVAKETLDRYLKLKKNVIETYIPNIKEISLPYYGNEEIIITTKEATLKQVFVHTYNHDLKVKNKTNPEFIENPLKLKQKTI